jgi:hypothetical protein
VVFGAGSPTSRAEQRSSNSLIGRGQQVDDLASGALGPQIIKVPGSTRARCLANGSTASIRFAHVSGVARLASSRAQRGMS